MSIGPPSANDFIQKYKNFRSEPSRNKGVELFNGWVANYDQNTNPRTVTMIFNLVSELEDKSLIRSDEKKGMYERALTVIGTGKDEDLNVFLDQRRAEIK